VAAPARRAGWWPAGLATVAGVAWLGSTLLAYRRFPGRFGPAGNSTFSQLGDHSLNPGGATVARVGSAIAGLALVAFFASLGRWRRSGTPTANAALWALRGGGALGGVGLVMVAVHPEGSQLATHLRWARVLFVSFGIAMFVAPVALRRAGRRRPGLLVVGVVGSGAVAASLAFPAAKGLEWVDVGGIGSFVGLLAVLSTPTRFQVGRTTGR